VILKYFGSFRENDDMLIIGNDIMKEINFSEVKHNKNRRFNTKKQKTKTKKKSTEGQLQHNMVEFNFSK
jgi:hypothetical protein